MRYSIIENGKVINIIESDGPLPSVEMVLAGDAHIGDDWDGVKFIRQPAIPINVPVAITMRQARLALLGAGLLKNVNAAIAGMAGSDGDRARIYWEYSSEVRREEPLVIILGAALNLNPDEVDTLFITGAAL